MKRTRLLFILLITTATLSLLLGLGNAAAAVTGRPARAAGTLPQIDLNGSQQPGIDFHTTYTENIGFQSIVDTTSLTISDTDSIHLTSATITLAQLPNGSDEALKVDTSGTTLVASYNSKTGSLTITAPNGRDTLTNFQKVLRTICYDNQSDNPQPIPRTAQFVVKDGNAQSPPANALITIEPINDAPQLDNRQPHPLTDIVEDDVTNTGNQVGELLNAHGAGPIIDDIDGPLEGIAIVSANNSQGKWQFKTATNWVDIGNVTEQTAVLLDPSTRLRFLPAPQFSGNSSLTFRAWDQSDGRTSGSSGINTSTNGSATPFSSAIAQATIAVEPQNDTPIIDLNGPEPGTTFQATFTEDSGKTPIVDPAQLTVTDLDSAQLTVAFVKLTNKPDGTQESLTTEITLPEIAITYNANSGELRLQGPATPAQFQQVLRSVVYNNLSQNPTNSDRQVEFTVSDGISTSVKAISTIAINRVNDAPLLNTTTPFTLTPMDEDAPAPLGNLISNIIASGEPNAITDVDNEFRGVAVIGVDDSNGRWQYRINGNTEWLDFTAVSSISATLLSSDERIRFLPHANYAGSASLTFRAWDRSGNSPIGATNVNTNINGGTTPFSAAQATATIHVQSINDLPLLDLNGTAPGREYTASFNEAQGPVTIVSPTLTLQDVDNLNLQSAQITINNLLDPSQEILNVANPGGLTVNFNPAAGHLTISGLATIDQYQTVLRTTTYNNLSQAPTDSENRYVTFIVTDDSGASSEPVTSTVRINPANNVPIIHSFAITGTEDVALSFSLGLFNQHFADPDGDNLTELKITALPTNGTMELAGTPIAAGQPIPATQIGQLRFVPTANWHGITSLEWNGKDDEVYPATGGTVTMTITSVNDAPTLNSVNKEGTEDERLWFELADFATQFNDIDGDPLASIQIKSLPGRGVLRFGETAVSINSTYPATALSQLSFTPEKDWTGIISFDWLASDGQLTAEGVASVVMTITAVNDPPTLTPLSKFGSEDNALSFTLANFTASYSDIEGNALQKIEITSLPANGMLYLGTTPVTTGQTINAADVATLKLIPASHWFGTTHFGWNASDGQRYAVEGSQVEVTITAVNDPPTLDLNGGAAGTSYEAAFHATSGTISIVSRNLTLSDIDSETVSAVTITLQHRPDKDQESLLADTSDTAISAAYSNATGILTLSGSDTTTNYQKVLRTIRYRNNSPDPTITNRTITFIVSDGTNSSDIAQSTIVPPYQTNLPLVAKNLRRSDEPNNDCRQAFPLTGNQTYQFLPNDQEDWYQFTLPAAAAVTIELTNFVPQANGQLIAYTGTCPSGLTLLAQNGDHSTTKILNLGHQPAGTYFIRIFNGGPANTKDLYRLRIHY